METMKPFTGHEESGFSDAKLKEQEHQI